MPSFGPTLVANDLIEVMAIARTTDQIGLNIFHYKVVNAGVGDVLSRVTQALEAFGTPFSTSLKALMSSSAEFRGYQVRRLNAPQSVWFQDATGAGPGTVAGDMLPRQVAGLLSKRVNVPGRRKGGRMYVPFPGEGDNDATSLPSAAYVVRLQTHAGNVLSSLAVGLTFNADPVVQQITYVGGVMFLGASRAITEVRSSDRWATQRRRGSYGRKNVSPL